MSESVAEGTMVFHQGGALCVDMSTGGMLLLMSEAPRVGQVFSVRTPTRGTRESAPKVVEVRWTRPSSADVTERMYLAGVKFLFS